MISFDQITDLVSQFTDDTQEFAPDQLMEQLTQFGLDAEMAQNLDLGNIANQLMENGVDVSTLDAGALQTLAQDLAAGSSLGEIVEHITSIKG